MKRPAVQCPQFVVDVDVLDGRDLDCVRSRKVKSSSTAGRPTNLQKLNLSFCTQITNAGVAELQDRQVALISPAPPSDDRGRASDLAVNGPERHRRPPPCPAPWDAPCAISDCLIGSGIMTIRGMLASGCRTS